MHKSINCINKYKLARCFSLPVPSDSGWHGHKALIFGGSRAFPMGWLSNYVKIGCCIVTMGLVQAARSGDCQTNSAGFVPDARLLLKGMVSARQQAPPSRLWLRSLYSSQLFDRDDQFLVEFDGDRRRFICIEADKPDKTAQKIQYDGKDVTYYNGQNNINIFNLGRDISNLIFDPRLLGITATYQGLESIFDYGDAPTNTWRVELVGSEIIDSKNTWHVCVFGPGVDYNWWIDDINAFRVYRYVVNIKAVGHYDVVSFYDEKYPWLPTKIEQSDFDEKGAVTRKRSFIVVKAENGVKFLENAWTLSGMGLPTNDIPVVDLRIQKIVGYWNGNRVRPYDEPVLPATSEKPVAGLRRTLFITILLAVFVAPLGWLICNRTKILRIQVKVK